MHRGPCHQHLDGKSVVKSVRLLSPRRGGHQAPASVQQAGQQPGVRCRPSNRWAWLNVVVALQRAARPGQRRALAAGRLCVRKPPVPGRRRAVRAPGIVPTAPKSSLTSANGSMSRALAAESRGRRFEARSSRWAAAHRAPPVAAPKQDKTLDQRKSSTGADLLHPDFLITTSDQRAAC